MKNRYLLSLVLALYSFAVVSCSHRTETITATTHPDGSVVSQTQHNQTQLGGTTVYSRTPEGGVFYASDMSKSFGHAMMAAAAAVGMLSWADVSKAETLATEASRQAGIKATAAVQSQRLTSAAQTATTLGSNPEANVGAIDAVGNLFKP